MKTKGLNQRDRLGILFGTVLTFLMLPLSLMVAVIPAVSIADWVASPVLSLSIKLGFFAVAAIFTFIQAIIMGLAMSYFLGWIDGKLHFSVSVVNLLAKFKGDNIELEACQKTNYGALIGAAGALVLFIFGGGVPIHSLSKRVEHLFPGPLLMSLGDVFRFDLSLVFAEATGFLAVGFLFAIVGIVLGSLCSAVLEIAVSHQE